ncbi:uncharacterized protein F5891DRAFT_991480 [Suillus fuscotomentosus]|uniref:Uncharacterized protein n=1 Tax=Suillus fuscotomentosus TaxID=1912939 RepID=A0AAD4DMM3_9AGAM|nr:uncharacterized protein F5891DRAFT_991480 [Suillus fuscotomentosus]KAG1879958.1 hypothetical protein F5891DRAFT_991480 [Suillus fuscotomentosus]
MSVVELRKTKQHIPRFPLHWNLFFNPVASDHKIAVCVVSLPCIACVKNVLKGQIRRAWLQLVTGRCPEGVGRCPEGVGRCPEGVGRCPESDVRCAGIPADVREQEIRLIRTKSELERKQRRTTKGRGGGDKSIGINPKTSGGRREDNSSRTEEGMSRV